MDELTENEKIYGKWFITHQKVNQSKLKFDKINLDKCKFVKAPVDYFYADPICIKHNDLYYIFFENFNYSKGQIAYYTVDKDLNISAVYPIDIGVQVHCSFPYIFKENDTYYMIPETCHLNKINLYECISFPDKWEFKKTLIDNVHSGDNQIVKIQNTYYLFSLIFDEIKNNLCIHYANDLLGEWKKHDLVNLDRKLDNEYVSRGAGLIFEKDGKLIRPAQFSDRGMNGEAIILYEIRNISHEQYHEVPLAIIAPSDLSKARCYHTFSLCDDLLTIDARLVRDTDFDHKPIDSKKEFKKIMEVNTYFNHNILEKAFNINTSGDGKGSAYYKITVDKTTYGGERHWEPRWDLIKDCIDFANKNVLEVGCNMGIALTYLKKFRNINRAVGVDGTDEFLAQSNKKDTIKAAKLLDEGFCVKDIDYIQLDFNKDKYEEILGKNFNVIIAMSILRWISDSDRFLKYLSNFENIIYEGHESDETEIEKFNKLGFKSKILGKTQTGASYAEDHTRSVILFYKEKKK